MTTEADARRARLGDTAAARARDVGEQAPELTPAQRDALAALMRPTRTTKASRKAA